MKYIFLILALLPQQALAAKMQCKITSEVNGTERPPAILEIITDRSRPCTMNSKTYIIPKTDVLVTAIYRSICSASGKTIPAGIEMIEIYDQVTKNYTKTWDSHGPQPRASVHFVTNGIERVSLQASCNLLP